MILSQPTSPGVSTRPTFYDLKRRRQGHRLKGRRAAEGTELIEKAMAQPPPNATLGGSDEPQEPTHQHRHRRSEANVLHVHDHRKHDQ